MNEYNDIFISIQFSAYPSDKRQEFFPGPAHDCYVVYLKLPYIHESLEALAVIRCFNVKCANTVLVFSLVVAPSLIALLPALVPGI